MAEGVQKSDEDRFVEVWRSERRPFGRWVRGVGDSFPTTGLFLESAASLLSVTPAELEAVLQLAVLDDEELALIGIEPPPKTTWFLLAAATPQGIEAAAKALHERDPLARAFDTVNDALHATEGPSEYERVAALPWEVFAHMSRKATEYDRLSDRHRGALKSFGARKKGGRQLTGAQVAYATDLLTTLADEGVVVRNSPDGDQAICDQVLDALGLP